MSIETIQTRVTKIDDNSWSRTRQLAKRGEDLHSHAQAGYTLAHTATIASAGYVTFVDTLTRVND
ncbi:hypothetical protein B7495_18010 (plasmid) [Cryobacterium sp. LW097]|uniref:hypothetical protein n=1 Tax=unclassified Cryobacterium TaxID=2649013 RepID=UPI000B4DC9EC|nr:MULTISPECIES: hypothetical protein [unclassified Cryobacterium]ASD24187.1 hypothetical protein B7495_18010 [Cryobacterium sp. LW097]TFC56826.1 hypothetical protein E3O60_16900 [Cryobacterium sp. TMB1-7]